MFPFFSASALSFVLFGSLLSESIISFSSLHPPSTCLPKLRSRVGELSFESFSLSLFFPLSIIFFITSSPLDLFSTLSQSACCAPAGAPAVPTGCMLMEVESSRPSVVRDRILLPWSGKRVSFCYVLLDERRTGRRCWWEREEKGVGFLWWGSWRCEQVPVRERADSKVTVRRKSTSG